LKNTKQPSNTEEDKKKKQEEEDKFFADKEIEVKKLDEKLKAIDVEFKFAIDTVSIEMTGNKSD